MAEKKEGWGDRSWSEGFRYSSEGGQNVSSVAKTWCAYTQQQHNAEKNAVASNCDSLWVTFVFFRFLPQDRITRARHLPRSLPGPPALPEPTSASDDPRRGAAFQVTASQWLCWRPRSEAASCFHSIKKKKRQTNNYKKRKSFNNKHKKAVRRLRSKNSGVQQPASRRQLAQAIGSWERASLAPWRLPAALRRGPQADVRVGPPRGGPQVGLGRPVQCPVSSWIAPQTEASEPPRATWPAACLTSWRKVFPYPQPEPFFFQFVSDTVILLPCTTVKFLLLPSQ